MRITSVKRQIYTQPPIPAHDHFRTSFHALQRSHSSPSIVLALARSLARSLALSLSLSPFFLPFLPFTLSHAPALSLSLSLSLSATFATVSGEIEVCAIPTEAVLRRNSALLTSYEPRLSLASRPEQSAKGALAPPTTASCRKSNLEIFENNNKMAGKSLRDHCGQTAATIGLTIRTRPIGVTLNGCFS